MQTVAYLRWSPAQSPVQIEFPAELLRSVNEVGQGILEGTCFGQEIRLAGIRPGTDFGTSALGVFFRRDHGEVFLTERELASVLSSGARIALVISGHRAGFFIREHDGAIESLRSYEEFAVPPPHDRLPAGLHSVVQPVRLAKRSASLEWGWVAMAVALFLAIPSAGVVYVLPRLPVPLQLTVREQAGQLLVTWNPRANLAKGRIEITDGRSRAMAMIGPGQSNATYVVRDGQITVTLRTNSELERERSETVMFVGKPASLPLEPAPPPSDDLEQQVGQLRAALDAGRQRLGSLQRVIASIADIPAEGSGSTPEQ